jgi:hypothetical protein
MRNKKCGDNSQGYSGSEGVTATLIFFHSKATQHYRCNWIQSIWDRNNVLKTEEEEIATVFTDYY